MPAALTLQSLRVTIGPLQASTTSLESQESYLTAGMLPYNRNVTLQTFLSSTRDFYRLHSTFARLYNAAASPASRLRSAGSLAIKGITRVYRELQGYTRVYKGLQGSTRVYRGLQGIQGITRVCRALQGYTKVYRG